MRNDQFFWKYLKQSFDKYLAYADGNIVVSLQDEINAKSKEIKTDAYSMSIGELMNLYSSNELDIHPEFQRFFRWKEDQQSKFIESIFLGIPIPSIFVSQRDDGVWDVIDGLQRLSTIFQFAGILKDENNALYTPSILTSTKYLPSLENKKWDDKADPINSLTQSQRIHLKRQKLDIKIVIETSDPEIKYELFQRINSLGTKLSDQELRNCILIMADKSFFAWIDELSKYEAFQNCVSLSDNDIDQQYDKELVLRFFIFKNVESTTLGEQKNIAEFIDKKSIQFTNRSLFNRDNEAQIFRKTFDLLNNTLADRSFKKYNHERQRFEGKFLVTTFEATSIGVASNIAAWEQSGLTVEQMTERLMQKSGQLWQDETYLSSIGRGARFNTRARDIIPVGKRIFVP